MKKNTAQFTLQHSRPARKTKIVCTIGPSCDDPEILRGLLQNGMDCARMNFSHATHEEHLERLNLFRSIRDELGLNVPVLLDTKGPEIRTGEFKDKIMLKKGQTFIIRHQDVVGDAKQMSVSYKDLHKDVNPDDQLLIDDGLVGLRICDINDQNDITCIVENGGEVSSKKSINVPGIPINLPFLSEKDISDIQFAIDHDYDFIALSFVRNAADILLVRKLLEQANASHIGIISKIENQQGVDNIDEIIKESDGVMVARGDLGVEIPVERVPIIQKQIIKRCLKACKIVITATQMLDSMIRNPRPTRAEASDVANAIFDGTSCIMLSGETANGKYPIESLITMDHIALGAENDINYWKRVKEADYHNTTVMESIAYATCTTAMALGAAAIVAVTKAGGTVRSISRSHPQCPIIAATTDPHVNRQLRLYWGVYSYLASEVATTDELFDLATSTAINSGLVHEGEMVVITGGVPVGISGTTNMLKVQMLGNILCLGIGIGKNNALGPAIIVNNPYQMRAEDCKDKIIVARDIDDALLPLLRLAKGVVVERNGHPEQANIAHMTLNIPVIVSTGGAMSVVQDGMGIYIDAVSGIVKPA